MKTFFTQVCRKCYLVHTWKSPQKNGKPCLSWSSEKFFIFKQKTQILAMVFVQNQIRYFSVPNQNIQIINSALKLKIYFKLLTYLNKIIHILKVQSCKLCNNKYVIASTQQLRNAEIFALIDVVVFKLLSHKVLLRKRKEIETVKKQASIYENSKFCG